MRTYYRGTHEVPRSALDPMMIRVDEALYGPAAGKTRDTITFVCPLRDTMAEASADITLDGKQMGSVERVEVPDDYAP